MGIPPIGRWRWEVAEVASRRSILVSSLIASLLSLAAAAVALAGTAPGPGLH
jgi:hypothetical protein